MTRAATTRPKPAAKWRTCLGCGKKIWSTGNRLCGKCHSRNDASPLPPHRAGAGVKLPYVYGDDDERSET